MGLLPPLLHLPLMHCSVPWILASIPSLCWNCILKHLLVKLDRALFFLCTALCLWGSWLPQKLSSISISVLLVLLILTAPQYLLLAPLLLPLLLSVAQGFLLGNPIQHWTYCTNASSAHMSKPDHLSNSRINFLFGISVEPAQHRTHSSYFLKFKDLFEDHWYFDNVSLI